MHVGILSRSLGVDDGGTDYPDPPRPGWDTADDWDDSASNEQGNNGSDG